MSSIEALDSSPNSALVGHFINGQIVADSARAQDVFNPATGEASKQVALASAAELNQAIEA